MFCFSGPARTVDYTLLAVPRWFSVTLLCLVCMLDGSIRTETRSDGRQTEGSVSVVFVLYSMCCGALMRSKIDVKGQCRVPLKNLI